MPRELHAFFGRSAARRPALAKALLGESATRFLNGEPANARLALRDVVQATIGFRRLAVLTGKPGTSLRRMLSERGNPGMNDLAAIFNAVRRKLKVQIRVTTQPIGRVARV